MPWLEFTTVFQTRILSAHLNGDIYAEACIGSDTMPDLAAMLDIWPYTCEIITLTTVEVGTPDERHIIVDEY